jgi:hypothetical protein
MYMWAGFNWTRIVFKTNFKVVRVKAPRKLNALLRVKFTTHSFLTKVLAFLTVQVLEKNYSCEAECSTQTAKNITKF